MYIIKLIDSDMEDMYLYIKSDSVFSPDTYKFDSYSLTTDKKLALMMDLNTLIGAINVIFTTRTKNLQIKIEETE